MPTGTFEFRLAAVGMSQAIVAVPGTYQGGSTVIRPGRPTPIETGKTVSGRTIVAAQPDLYTYSLFIPTDSDDWDLMQQLLEIQDGAVGTVQFADYLAPIAVSRITGNRVALGNVAAGPVSGINRDNFQGCCVVENSTANEAVPIGEFENGETAYLMSYTVREI